jgi:hypothetical protein
MVGGPDGHHRLVMETTLVMWQSFGVSGVHGGGREGMESIVWLSVAESLDNNFYCSHWGLGCCLSHRVCWAPYHLGRSSVSRWCLELVLLLYFAALRWWSWLYQSLFYLNANHARHDLEKELAKVQQEIKRLCQDKIGHHKKASSSSSC